MECYDENDNDNNMIVECNEEMDDSYILPEHKRQLLITIKKIYEKNYEWADDILMKCMIKEHYKSVIKNMIKSDYLEEISKSDIDTLIEQL